MKKKGNFSTFLLILLLILGLSLLLYPTVSEAWNTRYHRRSLEDYTNAVATLDPDRYQKFWEDAVAFTRMRRQSTEIFELSQEEKDLYSQVLNLSGDGIMGFIEIPTIGSKLSIYHGTEEAVLQVGIGHLEWSSLPVGGADTHCILSGHRGLPSARLFTDLDKLQIGDTFVLKILDEQLTYEVDQILIVLPHETDALLIEEGKDLCTLVTCTPYGVNSHRMLVRGHRVENAAQAVTHRVTADALRMEPLAVAAVLFFPILVLMLMVSSVLERLLRTKRKNISGRKYHEDI